MTTIRLHGILAQKYGREFKMHLDKPRDVIRAIDANRSGFRKTVVDLQKEGFTYELLINKKRLNKESFINHKQADQIDFIPFIVGSGWPQFFMFVFTQALSYALTDPGTIDGGEAEVAGGSASLIFSSSQNNLTAQGSPLPIGYGRLRVGSSVVQSSLKSFPQNLASIDVMTANAVEDMDSDIELGTTVTKSTLQ